MPQEETKTDIGSFSPENVETPVKPTLRPVVGREMRSSAQDLLNEELRNRKREIDALTIQTETANQRAEAAEIALAESKRSSEETITELGNKLAELEKRMTEMSSLLNKKSEVEQVPITTTAKIFRPNISNWRSRLPNTKPDISDEPVHQETVAQTPEVIIETQTPQEAVTKQPLPEVEVKPENVETIESATPSHVTVEKPEMTIERLNNIVGKRVRFDRESIVSALTMATHK